MLNILKKLQKKSSADPSTFTPPIGRLIPNEEWDDDAYLDTPIPDDIVSQIYNWEDETDI